MALVAFDFDGTLSADEMIVRLGERTDNGGAIRAVTERAMAGDIEYAESLRERVALLAGLSAEEVSAAYDAVELRPGMAELLACLDAAPVRVAVVTGGFADGVEAVLDRAGVDVDRIVANRLLVDRDGALTGVVEGPLVEGGKDAALRSLATQLDVDLAESIAIGDGANDLPMLSAAGTAIGFRPESVLVARCDVVVETVAELRDALVDLGVIDPG